MSRADREAIPPSLRREILASRTCHYCDAQWAGVIDHVIPVKLGGTSARGNLVAACDRCNSEKSGRTPAQWRTAREQAGKSWPPRNCQNVLTWLLRLHFTEDDIRVVALAAQADYQPLMAAIDAFHDAHYAENDPADGDNSDIADIIALAREWQAEVDVCAG